MSKIIVLLWFVKDPQNLITDLSDNALSCVCFSACTSLLSRGWTRLMIHISIGPPASGLDFPRDRGEGRVHWPRKWTVWNHTAGKLFGLKEKAIGKDANVKSSLCRPLPWRSLRLGAVWKGERRDCRRKILSF